MEWSFYKRGYLDLLVWIDFENAPHVWVFKEFIKRFELDNIEVLISARDFSYTLQLCEYFRINAIVVDSKSKSKSNLSKLKSVIERGFKLRDFLKKNKIEPTLSISHGSRSQAFASYLLNIKNISLDDYEHSFRLFNYFVNHLLTPFPIKPENWGIFKNKVVNYPGLKEELYLFNSDDFSKLKIDFIDNNNINVLFRPESNFTHYSSKKSYELQNIIINRISEIKNVNLIVLPRNSEQKKGLIKIFEEKNINYVIPDKIINGAALIYNSDIVIGGGGTMTREAAIMGIPSYSFFAGKLGEVDVYLGKIGKLKLLKNEKDVSDIDFSKRVKTLPKIKKDAFEFVYDFFLQHIKN